MSRAGALSILFLSFCTNAVLARADLADCVAGGRRFEKRYERFAAKIDVSRFRPKTFDDDKSIPSDRMFIHSTIEFWRDGRTARILQRDEHRRQEGDRIAVWLAPFFECLATAEIRVSVSRDAATGQFEGPNLTAEFADGAKEPIRWIISGIDSFILAGRIDTTGPGLVDRINVAKTVLTKDRVNGQPALRVEFEDAWGINVVWFDPAHDYHPVKFTQRKLPHHWSRPDVRMDQVPPSPKFGQLIEMNKENTVTEFQKIGGEWFAKGFESRTTYQSSDSKAAEDKVVVRINDLSLDPHARKNEFKIQTPVPNGTWVLVGNQRTLRYEWHDGKVVKVEGKEK